MRYLMVESVQFVTIISKLRGIYPVNIHSVTIVYILILLVTAILRSLVWVFIVQFAVYTFLTQELLTILKNGQSAFRKISFLKNMHTALVKYFVNLAYVREKKKTPHTFVFIATKKCARTAQNRGPITRNHQVSLLSEITYADLVPDQIKGEFCVLHQDIPITLFCQDHEEPC